jgi:Ni/Co efflux regulator RcnB
MSPAGNQKVRENSSCSLFVLMLSSVYRSLGAVLSVQGVLVMANSVFGVLLSGLLATAVVAAPYAAFAQDAKPEAKTEIKVAAKPDAVDDAKAEAKAKRPLTAQQQKLKDCGAKWQEEKKTKGVKGLEAWNKFRGDCMKS